MKDHFLRLHSPAIHTFLQRIEEMAREILIKEMGQNYKRSRVTLGAYTFPIQFAIFEDDHQLGHFEADNFRISLNRRLMWSAKTEVIRNVLRHELAHYYQYMNSHRTSHDTEFRDVCRQFGWGEEVYSARANIPDQNDRIEGDLPSERLIQKIQKLLALSESSNPHEAQAATLKANQLLLQHNLDNLRLAPDQSETVVLTVYASARYDGKMRAIAKILECFYVGSIFCKRGKSRAIEVYGPKTNVIIAEYVAKFLDHELERLWKLAKKANPSELFGSAAKNSFFMGVASGYVAKNRESLGTQEIASSSELIQIKNQLKFHQNQAYGDGLSTIRSRASHDSFGHEAGRQRGHELQIHRPLSQNKSPVFHLE